MFTQFNPLLPLFILVGYLLAPVIGQTNNDDIRGPIVTLHSQVNDNEALLRLIVDFVQSNNPNLKEIFNATEPDGILAMFDTFSTLDATTIDAAFAALALNITCFENLFARYPIDYDTFLRFEISLPHLLAGINTHVGGVSYGHIWEALGINAIQISFHQMLSKWRELFELVQTTGIFTDSTMNKVFSYFPAKTLTERIAVFMGHINMTAVTKFVEIYNTDDIIEFINVCGIKTENLVNALGKIPFEVYQEFNVTQSIKEKLDEDITFGTIVQANQIVTKLETKAFDLQDLLKDYCTLTAVTFNDTKYTIINSTAYDNYTILETTGGLPQGIPFANVSSKITSKYCTYSTAQDNVVTLHNTQIYMETQYAWVAYFPGVSEYIIDGTPLVCKNTNNQLILFGLSMHDYIYIGNGTVKFDLLRELEYQNVVVGTADRIVFASGVADLQQAVEDPVLHNAISQGASNAGENVIENAQAQVEGTSVVKSSKDTSDKIIDMALQDALLSDNTLQLTDDVGSGVHSVQALPAKGVDQVSNAAVTLTNNAAVQEMGDGINSVVMGPSEMVGNTTGQVTGGALENGAVAQMNDGIGDAVLTVGDNADEVGVAQVGGTLWSLSEDAVVGDVVQETGSVLGTIEDANAVENIPIPDLPELGVPVIPVQSLNVPMIG